MLTIRVNVTGEGPAAKVADALVAGLLENMSASPWKLVVQTEKGDITRRINEGRPG